MKKILVVDDEAQTRDYLKKYLENQNFLKVKGYEKAEYVVSTASTKEEAEEIINRELFDFILIDLRLNDPSEFGGIEVFLWARNIQPNAKAIIVSAYPFADQVMVEFVNRLKNESDLDNLLNEIELKYYVSKVSERNVLFTVLDKLKELGNPDG